MEEIPQEQSLSSTFIYSMITAFSLFVVGYFLFPVFRTVFNTIISFIPANEQGIATTTANTFWTISKWTIVAFIFISAVYWVIWLLKKNVNEAQL